MDEARKRKPISEWLGEEIPPGETRSVELPISESYSSMTVRIPIQIRRAQHDGPVVFLTAIVTKEDTDSMGSQVGGNLFLAKPVKAQEMVDAIEQLLTDETQ